MKKSLVLAMAMALGVTASAYAANPFSDVPAGHWAYDSIDKLAAAGVIEGMGDGSYQGDRTMTRYEMAQIVAKAMAKGCNVDKLAAEFADELDALGVRVANLEKKADNVTITGEVAYHYAHRNAEGLSTVEKNRWRTRLFVKGQINEDWTYNARLENSVTIDNSDDENNFYMNRAWVDGRVGGLKVKAGKFHNPLADGNVYNDTMEGIKVSYGKNIVVSGFVANADAVTKKDDNIWGVSAETKLGKLGLKAEYTQYKAEDGLAGANVFGADNKIWDVVAKYKFDKNIGLDYTHINSDVEGTTHSQGHVVGLSYKGANKAQAGSWGMYAKYFNQANSTFVGTSHVSDAATDMAELGDFQGYGVGLTYALAKNIVWTSEYFNLDEKCGDESINMFWNQVVFSF